MQPSRPAPDSGASLRHISPAEWRWVLTASAVVLIAFSAPYLVGWLKSTPQSQFSGFVTGLEDINSYLAKMRYGAREGWELQIVYTSEPHQGGFVYLPLLALGKLTAWLTGEGANVSTSALVWAYHIARVLCGLLLLVTTFRFTAEFLTDVTQRRMAWLLACLAGGLGWLSLLFNSPVASLETLPIELYVPEAFSTLLLFSHPHLALARSLMLIGWLLMFASAQSAGWRLPLLSGAAWLGMGLCVPFYVALLGVLLFIWLAAQAIRYRRLPWAVILRAALAGLLPLAYLIYNAWLFTTNPIFAVWAAQNILPSPPVPAYLLAYAVFLALAVAAVPILRRQGIDQRSLLLIIWPLTSAVLIYLPINIQRRLLEGSIVPLAIMAAMGFARLTSNRSALIRRMLVAVIALALLPSTLLLIAGGIITASSAGWPVFHPSAELAAYDFLNSNAPADSIVFSTRDSGMVIPAYTHTRVYVGHGPETVDYIEKEALVAAMLASNDLASRDEFFEHNRIDYVWIGPPESQLCGEPQCETLFTQPQFDLVFKQGDYALYRVHR